MKELKEKSNKSSIKRVKEIINSASIKGIKVKNEHVYCSVNGKRSSKLQKQFDVFRKQLTYINMLIESFPEQDKKIFKEYVIENKTVKEINGSSSSIFHSLQKSSERFLAAIEDTDIINW